MSAYEVTAGWRLCDHLALFVLAAYPRAKPSLLLYVACVPVLVSAVLRDSLLYVSMWLSVKLSGILDLGVHVHPLHPMDTPMVNRNSLSQ